MDTYINVGNAGFRRARNSEYIDKSGLIAVVNRTLNTEQAFSCVTRSRRFGKSMPTKMLCAYYDQSCDSRALFADLEIAKDVSFEQHLNKYAVLYLDMTTFVTQFHNENIVKQIDSKLKDDVIRMIGGDRCKVAPTGFQNDMSLIRSRDDALTFLIHLGYLSYDRTKQGCYIPNREVAGEIVDFVK